MSSELKVKGCFFTPQMRTLCAVLELNEIKFTKEDIDVFKLNKRNQNFELGGYNVPTIEDGARTYIGDGPTLYKYICLTKSLLDQEGKLTQIEENFYPKRRMNADRRRVIDNFLDYVELMVRRNSSRLTKLVMQKLIRAEQKRKNMSDDDLEELHREMELFDSEKNALSIQEEQEVFFDIILQNLEKQISGCNNVQIDLNASYEKRTFSQLLEAFQTGEPISQLSGQVPKVFITGQEYSIADIAMFNEIQNVFGIVKLNGTHALIRETLQVKYPCVAAWLNSLQDLPVIRQYQVQFEKSYLENLQNVLSE